MNKIDKFLDELINRLNDKLNRAITNGCETDKWIEDQLKFNKHIGFKDGEFYKK